MLFVLSRTVKGSILLITLRTYFSSFAKYFRCSTFSGTARPRARNRHKTPYYCGCSEDKNHGDNNADSDNNFTTFRHETIISDVPGHFFRLSYSEGGRVSSRKPLFLWRACTSKYINKSCFYRLLSYRDRTYCHSSLFYNLSFGPLCFLLAHNDLLARNCYSSYLHPYKHP